MIETETPAERRLRALAAYPLEVSEPAEDAAAIDMGREALALLREFDPGDWDWNGWDRQRRALLARAGEE